MANQYELKRNFSTHKKEVLEFLRKVHSNTLEYYISYCRENHLPQSLMERQCLLDSLRYLEDYLYYYEFFYPKQFDSIFKNLREHLDVIAVLPRKRRGIYGEYVEKDNLVYINPELGNSSTLTSKERTRLYICHELGHIQNHEWILTGVDYVNKEGESFNTRQTMYEGLSLLDEATTQERAEAITYYFSGKKRPNLASRCGRLFDGEPYSSNFDYYGELEEPAIAFGKTLRGIGSSKTSQDIIHRLSIRTLDKEFVRKIFYEYQVDGHLDELYLLLAYMGIIKRASYAKFGYDDPYYISISKRARDELETMAGPLRDYRPPFSHYQ